MTDKLLQKEGGELQDERPWEGDGAGLKWLTVENPDVRLRECKPSIKAQTCLKRVAPVKNSQHLKAAS